MKTLHVTTLVLLISIIGYAQVGINTTTPNAQLDIRSSSQTTPSNTDGILIPKIDAFPATNPGLDQNGMLVFLTTAVGLNLPGFYYWEVASNTWIPLKGKEGGTLDEAYDFGGPGAGNTIIADAGAVTIAGTDGLVSTGTSGSGALAPDGPGVRMVWNPRKASFRAGNVTGTEWDDDNAGFFSIALGRNTTASNTASTAFGLETSATNTASTAFGFRSTASGSQSTAFGGNTTSSGFISTSFGSFTTAFGIISTAFGNNTTASGSTSTTFGSYNTAFSYGETVIGIGATTYTPSATGAIQFRAANATDRLFVIGNAIDTNNNNSVDDTERSDAMIVLKNGLTRLPSMDNAMIDAGDGKTVVIKEYLQSNGWSTFGNTGLNTTINFIGTTDDVDLIFRRNNQPSGRIGVTNIAFGVAALTSNVSGEDNTAYGNEALSSNISGSRNTAIGRYSLSTNTIGDGNTAIGFEALSYNISGLGNTAVGRSALVSNTIGNANTATGLYALRFNTSGNYNTAHGSAALNQNTTGQNNTANGAAALSSNTTGNFNCAFGYFALSSNTTANGNSANGHRALTNNTLGFDNSAYGREALLSNTTGRENTANGVEALYLNTTGGANSAFGTNALRSNVTGNSNTALGFSANVSTGGLSNATAIGTRALVGANNSLVLGSIAGLNGASNSVNVGIGTTVPLDRLHVVGNIRMVDGNQAAGSVMISDANGTASWQTLNVTSINGWSTTGNTGLSAATNFIGTTNGVDVIFRRNNIRAGRLGVNNTSFGVNALNPVVSGTFNTAMGSAALQNLTTGARNVAVGSVSLSANSSGNENTAVGVDALSLNDTGNNNTAVGRRAMGNTGAVSTGSNNTALGYFAYSTGDFSNSTALGANTAITASNQIRLGNAAVSSIGGFAAYTNLSDRRFKRNIQADVPGLAFIKRLKPVTYQMDMGSLARFLNTPDRARDREAERARESTPETGFIAQEVEQAARETGFVFNGVDAPKNSGDYYGLRYATFVVPLVKAVQEQQIIIENQQAEINQLKSELSNMQLHILQRLERLETKN